MTCERLWCLDALVRSGRFMQADFVVGWRLWRWRASGRQRASEFRLIGSFYSRSNVLRRTLIHRLLTDEGTAIRWRPVDRPRRRDGLLFRLLIKADLDAHVAAR